MHWGAPILILLLKQLCMITSQNHEYPFRTQSNCIPRSRRTYQDNQVVSFTILHMKSKMLSPMDVAQLLAIEHFAVCQSVTWHNSSEAGSNSFWKIFWMNNIYVVIQMEWFKCVEQDQLQLWNSLCHRSIWSTGWTWIWHTQATGEETKVLSMKLYKYVYDCKKKSSVKIKELHKIDQIEEKQSWSLL